MAKGSTAKNEIFSKLMKAFPNSFMYNDNKELRINLTEEGTPVQIKVTLVAAKVAVEPSEHNISESQTIQNTASGELNWEDPAPNTQEDSIVEPTEEEKNNVARLVKSLGL